MTDIGTDSFVHMEMSIGKDGIDMGQNERDYEKLEHIKREYKEIEMSEEQLDAMKQNISQAKTNKRVKSKKAIRMITAVAAVVAVFIALPNTSANVAYAMSNIPVIGKLVEVVTFRNYEYESERHNADIEVPELVSDGVIAVDEINVEIQEITDQIVAEFEENMKNEEGYQEVIVKHEVLVTTEEYFTLKLICYQGAGSGTEWDYFYTIDLNTGERLALADLFVEGADYITPISENIKEQMRDQMAADENVIYWLDDEDIPEWNFETITDETSFYVNGDGNVVICFDEGDVAPMYMGCVEFVIPDEVVAEIRK